MSDSELALRAQAIARCLSYNGNQHEAAAKHALLEMAHRLDSKDIKVRRKWVQFSVRNARGAHRSMTFLESIAWMLCRKKPERV